MKTFIVFIGGFLFLSTSAAAQNVEKKQAKIEKEQVTLTKVTPVKLKRIAPKKALTKKETAIPTKKETAIEPKK